MAPVTVYIPTQSYVREVRTGRVNATLADFNQQANTKLNLLERDFSSTISYFMLLSLVCTDTNG